MKQATSSWLGQLPADWMQTKLKWVVEPTRPITYGIVQAGPMVAGGIPYIRPVDMTEENGIIDLGCLMRTSDEIASSYKRSSLRGGDLVCSIGPSFGKLMVIPVDLDGANLTQGTARIAISSRHYSRYYFWVLRSRTSFCQWESGVGGATFRSLNLEPLAETVVPEPPLSEQIAIATFLDRESAKVDALVAEQKRLIELLREKREAVISNAVTKGLDQNVPMKNPGVEWLGDVPQHWNVKRLKHLIQERSSISYGIVQPGEPQDEGVPFIQTTNMTSGSFELESLQKTTTDIARAYPRSRLRGGDVVLGIRASIGAAHVVPTALEGVNLSRGVARIECGAQLFNAFLVACLHGKSVKQYWELSKQGSTFNEVSIETVRELAIALPPVPEQKAIVAFLERQLAMFNALENEAERATLLLQERRAALISAAVTGKIDVREKAPVELAVA